MPIQKSHFFRTMTMCAGILLAMVALSSAQQIKVDKTNRAISITATDSATAMADTAIVHIGYQVYGPDSETAYANGSKASNAIAKALADAGVPKDAIQSESQNIAETQPYENEKLPPAEQAQRKFRVQQSWTVKTKADNAAKILNDAVNAGANQSGQIDWTLADENALEAQAAGKALVRARGIAEQMAKGLGVKLGDLIYASNQQQAPVAVDRIQAFLANGPVVKAAPAPLPLSLNPRKVERSATVYAVFAIE
ncbi:MAG TPA: SIMPL domain-containing protein [Acidobacteriaceae bacterium]|jgi:hypothetical protein|nr:SIMPL domain-containing protein [Acidobacteriaceae bacterium]